MTFHSCTTANQTCPQTQPPAQSDKIRARESTPTPPKPPATHQVLHQIHNDDVCGKYTGDISKNRLPTLRPENLPDRSAGIFKFVDPAIPNPQAGNNLSQVVAEKNAARESRRKTNTKRRKTDNKITRCRRSVPTTQSSAVPVCAPSRPSLSRLSRGYKTELPIPPKER